jgi:hypothetical protein
MQADIGGAGVMVARLPRRRARAHLFTASGRGLLAVGVAAAALLIGLGAITDRANSTPQPTPYSFIGR